MSSRANTSERNLWHLPEVSSVEVLRVRYDKPRVYYLGKERQEAREAVEIMVRTVGEFPVRALSPALFIGDIPIIEYAIAGPNLYRFYAFNFQDLPDGAPISLGWPQFPERRVKTRFRYQVRNGPPVS